jgi:hypothetical protein
MKTIVIIFTISMLFTSCAAPGLYYWGDYPKTLYKYRKNADESSLNNHVEQLEKIIQTSKRRNIRVAPGLQAELGYYYLIMNKEDNAQIMFNAEMNMYPESEVLMKRILEKMEKGQP